MTEHLVRAEALLAETSRGRNAVRCVFDPGFLGLNLLNGVVAATAVATRHGSDRASVAGTLMFSFSFVAALALRTRSYVLGRFGLGNLAVGVAFFLRVSGWIAVPAVVLLNRAFVVSER